MQQFLKPAAGAARAGIVASELFLQVLDPAHDAKSALHARFGREAFGAFTGFLETRVRPGTCLSVS
jgi:hypothetical protein